MAGSESLKLDLKADGDPDHSESLAGWHRGPTSIEVDHDLNDDRHRRCSLSACARKTLNVAERGSMVAVRPWRVAGHWQLQTRARDRAGRRRAWAQRGRDFIRA
jgi:hypothetical protein